MTPGACYRCRSPGSHPPPLPGDPGVPPLESRASTPGFEAGVAQPAVRTVPPSSGGSGTWWGCPHSSHGLQGRPRPRDLRTAGDTYTHAGLSSCTRNLQVPWKQNWLWESGQSLKWDTTAAATGGRAAERRTCGSDPRPPPPAPPHGVLGAPRLRGRDRRRRPLVPPRTVHRAPTMWNTERTLRGTQRVGPAPARPHLNFCKATATFDLRFKRDFPEPRFRGKKPEGSHGAAPDPRGEAEGQRDGAQGPRGALP